MERKRLTLDSPVFEGKLRYTHRSSAYVRRGSQRVSASSIQDIVPHYVAPTPLAAKPAQATARMSAPGSAGPSVPPLMVPSKAPVSAQSPLASRLAIAPSHAATPTPAPRGQKKNISSFILYGMASLLFVMGLLVSWNGLKVNHQVVAQVKQGQLRTAQAVADTVVPTAVKPSAQVVKAYAVAPNLPKYIDIPKLKVHARVLSEGVTKTGELQVPWNIYDTGWYNASAQPGQAGAMLVDGHSGIGQLHGIFYHLAQLVAGDLINVTRGDGRVFTYAVVKTQTVDVKSVDMASTMVSADTAKPGLNLITCAGEQIPGTVELNKRVLVYAVLR